MKRTGLCFGFLGLAGALLAGSSTGSVDSRWNFHGWPGYLPNPVRTIVPGEGGRGASRFVDVAGRDGMCVVSPEAYPVHAGNTVVVEFRARGCGTATVTLHRATEKGAWNATTGDVTVRLEKEWQTYRVRTVVLDGSNGATRSVRVALGARTGAAEVVFGDVEVEVLPTALSVDERPFDPVVEGWPLVWRDEFDGKEVDWSRWFTFPPSQPKSYASLDGEGHLLIKADRKEGRKVVTTGLWSVPTFTYGYFEARVRFTRQPGWWAAFWMYGMSNTNPMADGFEIDIFEDYFTRRRTADGKPRQQLDHNLHLIADGVLKSWNWISSYDGPFDGWHVLGCKREPLRVTYYLDGRPIRSSAAHSTQGNVGFNAFEHGLGLTPLHVIVSGQVKAGEFAADAVFPEFYAVDYVRCYARPEADAKRAPSVGWAESDTCVLAPTGSVVRFGVKAKPSSGTHSRIARVALFDNSQLIAERTRPPYDFELPFTSERWAQTRWADVARNGGRSRFNGLAHAFSAVAVAEDGSAATTPVRFKVPLFGASRPRGGRAQAVPGTIDVCAWDEGGRGVAYGDTAAEPLVRPSGAVSGVTSGEWLNYTVDVARGGAYDATLTVGTPVPCRHTAFVLLDGGRIGAFRFNRHASDLWTCDTSVSTRLELPAGRHVVTLLLCGRFDFSKLVFSGVLPDGHNVDNTKEHCHE